MTDKMVLIEWQDSKFGSSEWEYIVDQKPLLPSLITTVGFLIDDNKAYKTIAHSIGGSQVCGLITIPTVSIKKIKKLKA